jgi:DNA-directed RNA polymerase specialized sigma24 family protein
VIGLRQFEGLTAAQAGARMGRSEAAVHSLYRRALESWESAASAPATRARGTHEP